MDNSYLGNFQMLGISSGMDTGAMIDALMKAERQPLNRVEEKYNDLALQQKSWMEVDDKLEEFWDEALKMRFQSNLNPKTATSSNDSVLSATANPTSLDSNFYVKVNQTASSSNMTFQNSVGFDYSNIAENTKFINMDQNITPETGTYTINYNDGADQSFEINIDDSTTIQDIIDQIDSGSGNKLKANLVDGKLTISEATPDEINNITLGNTSDTSNFSEVFDMAFSTYDGAKIESSSDVIDYSSMKLSNLIDVTAESTVNINGEDIIVNQDTTLASFISQINNSEAGVFASFDNNSKKISIRNMETGPVGLNITDDTTTNLFNKLGMSGTETINQGQKAEIEIYNSSSDITPITTLTSWDNNFDYNNTNINVNTTSTEKIAVEVNQDTDKAVENIQGFVDKYNETMEYLYEKLHEEKVTDVPEEEMTDEEKMQGTLKGDRNLERIFYQMRSIAYKTLDWDTTNSDDTIPEYTSLSQIGISSGDVGDNYDNTIKGLLSIDENDLKDALSNNFEDVYKLFANNNSYEVGGKTRYNKGIITELKDTSYEYTKFGGYIDNIAGTNGTIGIQMRDTAGRLTDLLDQLQRRELRYVQQFSAMEKAISNMNSQMSFMMSRLGG
jgi:flagellar hook-associated protein 2